MKIAYPRGSKRIEALVTMVCAALFAAVLGSASSASAATLSSQQLAASMSMSVSVPVPMSSAATPPIKPVAAVTLSRYVGRWFQLAAIPQLFELQCARDVTAVYRAGPDGTVVVTNTCTTPWGSPSQVVGAARVENAPANSLLTVSFFNLFGHQLYFGGPNYAIVGLSGNYRWAVVASPDRGSAFVLSRSRMLSEADTASVRAVLARNAINACSLTVTPQTGGATAAAPFC